MTKEQRKQRIKAYGMLVDGINMLNNLYHSKDEKLLFDSIYETVIDVYTTEVESDQNMTILEERFLKEIEILNRDGEQ